MDKVLIITYYWPPGAGAGVQRWLKITKYLPQFGWEPIILTVDPEYSQYPATDETLLNDIHSSVRVIKTKAKNYFKLVSRDRTRIPSAGFANEENKGIWTYFMRFARGNFFIPDPRRGWNSYAFREACNIIEKEKIKRVITTSPPHSSQLIGLKLKKKYPHIKWISDIRDPWTDIYYYKELLHTPPALMLDRHYEKCVLKKADIIITVGDRLGIMLAGKVKGIEKKTYVIPNGYDEEDFIGRQQNQPEKITITYTGSISSAYPVEGFAKAVKGMIDAGTDIHLRFVGPVAAKEKKIILSYVPDNFTEFLQYVNHDQALRFMLTSSILLLIIPDHYGNRAILTGKLFEYMAAEKPVLCLGPADGDAAMILEMTGTGATANYYDTETITEIITSYIKTGITPLREKIQLFSRRNLAKKVSEIIK